MRATARANPSNTGTATTTGNAPPAESVLRPATVTWTGGLTASEPVPADDAPWGSTTTYTLNRPALTACSSKDSVVAVPGVSGGSSRVRLPDQSSGST